MPDLSAIRPPLKPRRWRFTMLVYASLVLFVSVLLVLFLQGRFKDEPKAAVAVPVVPVAAAPEPKPVAAPAVVPAIKALPQTIDGLTELASAGDARACFELGERYRTGRGAIRDEEAALKWYTAAGVAKDADLLVKLADVYEAWGYNNRAVDHYERAAFAGNHDAQLRLAFRKSTMTVDTYAWLNICASWGNTDAVKALDEIDKAYTSDFIKKGQVRSRELLNIIVSNTKTVEKAGDSPAK